MNQRDDLGIQRRTTASARTINSGPAGVRTLIVSEPVTLNGVMDTPVGQLTAEFANSYDGRAPTFRIQTGKCDVRPHCRLDLCSLRFS